MKKIVKKNYKILIGIVIGIIVSTAVTYGAEQLISGNEVLYNNGASQGTSDNVQGAIDELYNKLYDKSLITAYTYNETKGDNNYCVNGEEKTCKKTECYKKGSKCNQGTIIKYYVRENEYHYFYVLHDDGEKITMQQRENTVRNIPWNEIIQDNSKGPITILNALEQATSTWTNVNVIEYTPGVTELNGNKFTGCTYNSGKDADYKIRCEENIYENFGFRKARARMITALEASETGCLMYKNGDEDNRKLGNSIDTFNLGSCPDWMHNYLHGSTINGGSYNNDTLNENKVYDEVYWTMSANLDNDTAWIVNRIGNLYIYDVKSNIGGARAVVEINK